MKETGKTSTGLQQNLASLLCYAAWWITGIVFLIIEKENRFIRFHAIQSIITFGAVTVAQLIVAFIPVIGFALSWIIWVLSIILWIYCMLKAYQGQMFKLPVAGSIAEQQTNINTQK